MKITMFFFFAVVMHAQVIGTILSGNGQIDGVRVSDNATLLDGSVVTAISYSNLKLGTDTRMSLGAGSVVRVFAHRASLEGGTVEVESTSDFTIDARTLRIRPAEPASIARVRLDGEQRVFVTAVNTSVDVWNQDGVLVARVMPSMALSFLPQAAASNTFNNTGCVFGTSKVAFFFDETGNQIFELRSTTKGVNLRKFLGKHARVTGTMGASATGVTQVVEVSTIQSVSGVCK